MRFLIVCEGTKTEPYYFKALVQGSMSDVRKVDIQGVDMGTVALIKETKAIKHNFSSTSPQVSFPTPRETCTLFQWEGEMFLVFSFKSHIVHLHFTISDAAKQISVVAVYQVGEINNLIRFLIAKGVKMGREHHRHVHLIEFWRQSLLHVIRSVPFL